MGKGSDVGLQTLREQLYLIAQLRPFYICMHNCDLSELQLLGTIHFCRSNREFFHALATLSASITQKISCRTAAMSTSVEPATTSVSSTTRKSDIQLFWNYGQTAYECVEKPEGHVYLRVKEFVGTHGKKP